MHLRPLAVLSLAILAVRDGRLAGRATGDFPLVHVERISGLDDDDLKPGARAPRPRA